MRSARRSFYKTHRRTAYGVGTNAYDRKSYGEDELEWPINNLPFGLKAHQPPDEEDETFEDEMPEEEIYLESSLEESLHCIEACNKQWCDMNNVERVLGLSRYDIVVEFEDYLRRSIGWGNFLCHYPGQTEIQPLTFTGFALPGKFCENYDSLKIACLERNSCFGIFFPYLVGFGLQNHISSIITQETFAPEWVIEMQAFKSMTLSDIMFEGITKGGK